MLPVQNMYKNVRKKYKGFYIINTKVENRFLV
jgi:hypothetical protein